MATIKVEKTVPIAIELPCNPRGKGRIAAIDTDIRHVDNRAIAR